MNITANSLHPGAIPTNLIRHHTFVEGKSLFLFFFFLEQIELKYPLERVVVEHSLNEININAAQKE